MTTDTVGQVVREKPKPSYAPVYAAALYPQLAELARTHGYALAVHGSLQRDFDLIAIPWVESPSEPQTFVDAITSGFAAKEVGGPPSDRPHGRRTWSLSIGFGTCAIDLSFMPRDADRLARIGEGEERYRYALSLIDAAAEDGDGMAGVAFSAQVPLDLIDGKRPSEIAALLCENAYPDTPPPASREGGHPAHSSEFAKRLLSHGIKLTTPDAGGLREAVPGAVWMDGVSLVRVGSEDEWCRDRGARRMYLDPRPAGDGVRVPMFGRMLEGDFTKDTITFQMEPGYYLASGRYEIRYVGSNYVAAAPAKGEGDAHG